MPFLVYDIGLTLKVAIKLLDKFFVKKE